MDTPACARLRIAYVQSLVSNIITDRIFQHFLFTHDHLDDTFNEWAEYLRHKSTKREAFWRQRTLHAAFSSHSSKAKINKFAGEIIEEIVSAIKPFGDTSKRQQMVTAVKQIVKTAAETWRYARIELARITAWPTTQLNEEEDGEHLLSVFPRIEREALPNDFRRDAEEDKGCVYSTGQTLSKKSSAVLARRVELGEIPPMPVVADDARREHRRPRKMSSEIASRARMFEPRSSSPLIAPPGDKESSRGKAATVSDEISDMNSAEQYQADSRHGSSDGRSMGSQEEAKETVDEGCWGAGAEHAAAPSPLQSPVHSRGGTPQLRAQSTGVSDSLVEDEEASEGMKKSATIPNWGGAGGDIPGAYGW